MTTPPHRAGVNAGVPGGVPGKTRSFVPLSSGFEPRIRAAGVENQGFHSLAASQFR